MKFLYRIILLIFTQYTLGRRGSYPFGIMSGFTLIEITVYVIISDIIQTMILLNFSKFLFSKILFLSKLAQKISKKLERQKEGIFKKLNINIYIFIMFVSALPYGGGALTGSIIAGSAGTSGFKSFLSITAGCIAGSVIFYFIFSAVLLL